MLSNWEENQLFSPKRVSKNFCVKIDMNKSMTLGCCLSSDVDQQAENIDVNFE